MDSSPPKRPEPTLPPAAPAAGTKRPPPTLLPPFEPLSSSPGLPRPAKRQATASDAYLKYPTPVPTSSTGILSSSPPRPRQALGGGLSRSQSSSASERAPLSAVPSVSLPANGDTLLMGRSSNSSNYQLSSNRLISRVHVRARYVAAPSPLEPSKLEIVCGGWNGLKLHCQGRSYELWKGDSFTSETEGSEVMLDVLDARVLVRWPRREAPEETEWEESPGSRRENTPAFLQSSPLRRQGRIQSPVSPTPGNLASSRRLQMLMPRGREENVDIYVDPSADEEEGEGEDEGSKGPAERVVDPNASLGTEATNSFSSDLSDLDDEDENDPDEENDPVVHSFGPFGANLSSRLASITATSPRVNRSTNQPLLPRVPEEEKQPKAEADEEPPEEPAARPETPAPEEAPYENPTVANHVVNQLAFSRLASTPLSTIMQNLPAGERSGVTKAQLQSLIEGTPCVGIIAREGKDAAGQPLESQYYYVPEEDGDGHRRAAVVEGMGKPSLRACRKQHKVSEVLDPGRALTLGFPCWLGWSVLTAFSNTTGRGRGRRESGGFCSQGVTSPTKECRYHAARRRPTATRPPTLLFNVLLASCRFFLGDIPPGRLYCFLFVCLTDCMNAHATRTVLCARGSFFGEKGEWIEGGEGSWGVGGEYSAGRRRYGH